MGLAGLQGAIALTIEAAIEAATGQRLRIVAAETVGGGCINQGYRLRCVLGEAALGVGRADDPNPSDSTYYFVKLNQASRVAMFEAEALGLRQMAAAQAIRVPRPVCWGTVEGSCYLVLEWLDLSGSSRATAWAEMGRQLARLHRLALSPQGFGWEMTNTIGSTPQPNPWHGDWVSFWQTQRIGFQLQLARRRGGDFPQGDRLLAAIPTLLSGHEPEPSLVHGDLWSGNAAIAASGIPVIFDPAAYYGDREVDLAMTELFGGFPAAFYQAYEATWPLEPGYRDRKVLYNLYHILNHFNLFGGGYASQANQMIKQLLR